MGCLSVSKKLVSLQELRELSEVGGFLVPNILGTLKQITYVTGYLVFSAIRIVAFLILVLAQLHGEKLGTWKELKLCLLFRNTRLSPSLK